ncbi:hypothetical protein MGYG_04213 [Nannizzia gypsea CBS 118893]|uniref:Uncharacterized protein n=1 Tax=Arthroderma gypseum (strain ATCC MYA-4604 / CBS 118893) TaxID=535722 RepID=E4URT8_ARTGP|nr:hypothetical protein MGYG_04213 [Nannizzia gypsea CBS 118893]EFR01210.1 hypothetical protein MGYG_04213 [Nannizzia gypsea CBS 118893]
MQSASCKAVRIIAFSTNYHATGALGHQASRKRALRQSRLSNHLLFWGNSQATVISATRERSGCHSFVRGSSRGSPEGNWSAAGLGLHACMYLYDDGTSGRADYQVNEPIFVYSADRYWKDQRTWLFLNQDGVNGVSCDLSESFLNHGLMAAHQDQEPGSRHELVEPNDANTAFAVDFRLFAIVGRGHRPALWTEYHDDSGSSRLFRVPPRLIRPPEPGSIALVIRRIAVLGECKGTWPFQPAIQSTSNLLFRTLDCWARFLKRTALTGLLLISVSASMQGGV